MYYRGDANAVMNAPWKVKRMVSRGLARPFHLSISLHMALWILCEILVCKSMGVNDVSQYGDMHEMSSNCVTEDI